VHCCTSTCVLTRGELKVLSSTTRELSHTHPQSRPTLRTAGTLQGVPPSWCGRRAAGVEWGVFEPTIKSKRHDAQAACEPGGGGCGGVPVHPARLHTHRTSPAQALLTTFDRDMLTPRLTCSRTPTVVCLMSSVH
jgi:hypothetical protein